MRPPKRALRLQPRDEQLLVDLYGYGCMLRGQIQSLYFGSVQRTNARLLQLCKAGYVTRADLPVPGEIGSQNGSQFAYLLAPRGIPIVAAATGIETDQIRQQQRRGTPTYLRHTIAIVGFRLAVERAAASIPEIGRVRFLPERLCRHAYRYLMREGTGETWHTEVYKPDAVFMLTMQGVKQGFSVEIDLGHTNAQEFQTKIAIHERYAQTPELFAQRYGAAKQAILVITTGALRRTHLLTLAARSNSGLTRITTFEEVRALGAFGAIWYAGESLLPDTLF